MFHSWTETQPPETTVCFIMCFWFLMLGSAFIPSFIKTDDIAHLTKTPKQSRSQRYQSVPSREETYPPDKAYLKMIFLFPRWDMLIPWRVNSLKFHKVYGLSVVGLFFAKWINNSVSWPSLPTKKKTVLVVFKNDLSSFVPPTISDPYKNDPISQFNKDSKICVRCSPLLVFSCISFGKTKRPSHRVFFARSNGTESRTSCLSDSKSNGKKWPTWLFRVSKK